MSKPSGTTTNPVALNPEVDMTGWRREMRAKRIKLDDAAKVVYCDTLRATGLKGISAIAAGVHPNTILSHIKADPDFADMVAEAIEKRRADFVVPIEQQALEGHKEITTTKDGGTVERTMFETGLRAMLLKKYDPEGHNPKTEIDLNVKSGGGVLVVPMRLTPEEWNLLYVPKDPPPEIEADATE